MNIIQRAVLKSRKSGPWGSIVKPTSFTRPYTNQSGDWLRLQVCQSTGNLRDDRVSFARSKHAMSTGVRSILCVILGVSGCLVSHANGSPYRDSYTMTLPEYDYNYPQKQIYREERALNEGNSGLVLLIDK